MKRILCLLLVLVLLMALLPGCSRKIDNTGYSPTGDAILMEGEEPTEAEEEEDAQNLVLAYYPDRSLNPIFGSDYTNRVLMSLMYQGLGGSGYHLPRHGKKPAWVYLRAVARLYLYGTFHGKSSLQSSIGQIYDLILYFTASAFPWQGSVAMGFLPYIAVF